MPVSLTSVIDGPRVQIDGRYKGRLAFSFADGRSFIRSVVVASQAEWDALPTTMPPLVEQQVAEADAVISVADADIATVEAGEASRELIALTYLRQAYASSDPYKAFRLFDRFNDYRLARGWPIQQVVNRLAAVGLTEDEWAALSAAYAYLNDAGRIATMQGYQTILQAWEARD